MKRVISGPIELLGERHARLLQDLVGSTEPAVLLLQLGDPGALVGREPRPSPVVDLGLADPGAERLRADVELTGDTGDDAVALAVLLHRRQDELDRSLLNLRRVPHR
jgi:hypothetical protein